MSSLFNGLFDEYDDGSYPGYGTTWKTKDGQKIYMKDMTNRHLLNTIAYLERRAGKIIDLWKEKDGKNFSNLIKALEDKCARQPYSHLLRERQRRKEEDPL